MATDLNNLQKLLTRLEDRADKLRAIDPALTRDLEALAAVLHQQHCFTLQLAQRELQMRERIRLLASTLLALDVLTSKAFGPVLIEQSRALLEQWVQEGAPKQDVRRAN